MDLIRKYSKELEKPQFYFSRDYGFEVTDLTFPQCIVICEKNA